eukprot:GHVR01061207.1.p1 GENE.GHVR01061207.1~~GHVR01061207.1.p1  ORF type:complete len:304 (+),score=41.24 GHVR01061207.1:50-961(+)
MSADKHVPVTPKKKPRFEYTAACVFCRTLDAVLFVGIIVSGAILFMVMVKMITPSNPDLWFEVSAQVLNGIFTFVALKEHPFRFIYCYRLFKIQSWKKKNCYADSLDSVPSKEKNHMEKLHKSFPFMISPDRSEEVVEEIDTVHDTIEEGVYPQQNKLTEFDIEKKKVEDPRCWLTDKDFILTICLVALQFNCWFQYVNAFAMWSYNFVTRPVWIVPVFLVLSFACSIIAGVIWGYQVLQYRKKYKKGKQITQEKYTDIEFKSVKDIVKDPKSSGDDLDDIEIIDIGSNIDTYKITHASESRK